LHCSLDLLTHCYAMQKLQFIINCFFFLNHIKSCLRTHRYFFSCHSNLLLKATFNELLCKQKCRIKIICTHTLATIRECFKRELWQSWNTTLIFLCVRFQKLNSREPEWTKIINKRVNLINSYQSRQLRIDCKRKKK
jgi:hypothetical protein